MNIQDATPIILTEEERAVLESMVRSPKTEQGVSERARMVLLAADGRSTRSIAAALGTWPGRVSRWRTRFAAEPQHLFHTIRTVVASGDDRIIYLVGLRVRSAGPFTSAIVGLHQSLSGHVRRAIGIESRLRRRATERDAAASALDRMPFGVALIDGKGRVLVANQTAQQIFGQQDGLSQRRGMLTTSLSSETAELAERITDVISGNFPVPRVVTVSRPSGQRPFGVLVLPLSNTVPDLERRLPVAAVFVTDAENAAPINERSLRTLYGFTPAEARLARLLAQGRRPEEAAAELGVSLNTVRTHLKRIFGKAGTDRQADLVRTILTSAAAVLD